MAVAQRSYVFVSYSRKDALYVDRLLAGLGAHRIPTWIDRHACAPARWASEIRERLDRSAAVLVVESSTSRSSQWVAREVERATEAQIPVHALLLDNNESKFGSAVCHTVTCTNGHAPRDVFKQLRRALKKGMSRNTCVRSTGSFFAGMDVHGVDFRSDLLLDGADFRGTNLADADLRWTNLGDADLTAANLANTQFSGAKLSSAGLRSTNCVFAKHTASRRVNESSLGPVYYRVSHLHNTASSGLKRRLQPRSPSQVLRAMWWRLRRLLACQSGNRSTLWSWSRRGQSSLNGFKPKFDGPLDLRDR